MDKNANPTPKTNTVANSASESDPEPEEAFKQKVLKTVTELYTDGDLEFMVRGHHKTHIAGSVTHTIGSTVLSKIGGSSTSAVGGAAISAVGGSAISAVDGASASVTHAARFQSAAARISISGYEYKRSQIMDTNYDLKFENGVERNQITATKENKVAPGVQQISEDKIDITAFRKDFDKVVLTLSNTKTFLGFSRLNNIKNIKDVVEIKTVL